MRGVSGPLQSQIDGSLCDIAAAVSQTERGNDGGPEGAVQVSGQAVDPGDGKPSVAGGPE